MDHVEAALRQVIPPHEIATIVDNVGLPVSSINLTYGNSGTVGSSDADILISLNRRITPARPSTCASCADGCRASFPA